MLLLNCETKIDVTSGFFNISPDLKGGIRVIGGSVTTTTAGLDDLARGSSPMTLFAGVDLTSVTGFILGVTGQFFSDDGFEFVLDRCTLDGSVGFTEESFTKQGHVFKATNCSSSSSAAEYQFFTDSYTGQIEDQDDAGIHRNESTAFADSAEKVSFKATTNTITSLATPLVFDLPARFMALSSASTDTARIYFAVANTVTLTDTNCWAELIYPDGTSKNVYNLLSNRNADILATGTTHTDDSASSTWKNGVSDLTAHNEYRMDLDTSGDIGADGVPTVRIYLAEPSVTVYFDTTVDVVA
jgi:hypothetical protein